MTSLLAVVGSLALTAGPPAQHAGTHPAIYVDEGACPFECCSYGKWHADAATVLFEEPEHRSRAIGRLAAGSAVDALGGKVITKAGRFVVNRDHEDHHRGDVLWVYTYLGEGLFRVWHDGHMDEEQLEFSPEGGTAGNRCQDSQSACWGELDRPLRMTWWIRVRDDAGREAWTDKPKNFSGNDVCG